MVKGKRVKSSTFISDSDVHDDGHGSVETWETANNNVSWRWIAQGRRGRGKVNDNHATYFLQVGILAICSASDGSEEVQSSLSRVEEEAKHLQGSNILHSYSLAI